MKIRHRPNRLSSPLNRLLSVLKQPHWLVCLLLFSLPSQAVVYKCVNEAGKTRYQSTVCEGISIRIDDWQPAHGSRPIFDATRHLPQARRSTRSEAAKNLFKAFHPCPSTGTDHGPCPGYVIDHIKPLACGGEDDPSNMQWQTVATGKAKDSWERKDCEPLKPIGTGTTRIPSRHVYIGPRGGRYTISPSGRKLYLRKR